MTDTYQTRSLVEGALFAALTVVIAAMGFFVPWLFFISSLLFPVPIILMVYRHGLKKGILSLITAYILLLVIYPDPISVTIIFVQFAPMGLLFGLLFKNKVSAGKSIFVGTLVAAVLTLIGIVLISIFTGINTMELHTQIQSEIENSIRIYQEVNSMSDSDIEQLRQTMEEFFDYIILLLPGILVIGSMLSTLISYIISRSLLIRLKHDVVPLPVFSKWTYPWYTVWGIIIGLAMTLIGNQYDYSMVSSVGKNILYVFSFSFLLLGISVVAYYYNKLPYGKGIKWLLIILAALFPLTPYMLIGVGVLDPLLDIRKLNKENREV